MVVFLLPIIMLLSFILCKCLVKCECRALGKGYKCVGGVLNERCDSSIAFEQNSQQFGSFARPI